ncbi:MAG: YdiU family protein [Caulobacteraceae bacterium]
MPVSSAYRPDPQFMALGPEFADPVAPAAFPEAVLRYRNQRWAARVGLDALTDGEWLDAFARFEPLPGNQPHPLATRYHGHQFQVYNPDIGDGRGFLYAQLREDGDPAGRLLDLGTKGSGQTPYSRFGDGRLTLKGGVREVLATEMLEALGVPTSKSFSLVETGEPLERPDEPSPTRSSVLTRLSWSNVRFGTFQRHAYFDHRMQVAGLIEHVIDLYYPEVGGAEIAEKAASLLRAVIARTAHMTARWMAAGFVHGVLNTDNMNINGESFDYGPYRFLPKNDPNFTAAYFDHQGLYAFGRQPQAVFWNLQQLAGCFALVCEQEALVDALNTFGSLYRDGLAEAIVRRLGLKPLSPPDNGVLAAVAFKALAEGGDALRWEPFFFDWFGGLASAPRALQGPRAGLYDTEAFRAFRTGLEAFETDRPQRLQHAYFGRSEPQELLYDEIETIWNAIAEGNDWSLFEAKLAGIGQARDGLALTA